MRTADPDRIRHDSGGEGGEGGKKDNANYDFVI